MMITELIAKREAAIAAKLKERNAKTDELTELRAAETTDQEKVDAVRAEKDAIDAEIRTLEEGLADLRAELAADEAADEKAREVNPGADPEKRDHAPARVGAEERTYRPDQDPKGLRFVSDIVAAFRGDFRAAERIARHNDEEKVERGLDQDDTFERAVGTGAFTGLVVPQYLVDQFAKLPRADQPLADAMRHHDLPETGMTAYIGKLTTGTSAAEQTAEHGTVSETDADDTLLTVPILTAAGSQTVSRQASERGVGVEDTIVEDLISAYRSNKDSLILNRASTGLTNIASAITYTDASPTAAELYPKLLQAPAQVEAAMLNAHPGDVIAVMHSRRWYWLQSQLSSTWPLFGQPGVAAQLAGENYGERYGNGFRGVLPNGTPVIVDNNIATNLGAGTNEDEMYFVSQMESHLWEDPSAPTLIRAEQPKAKTLGVDLVVYGYFAYLFNRVTHAQKIGGTGLVTPAWA